MNEKALHIQGRALLEKYDLPYAADEHSSHLKNGDRILIGMVRAITQGARILVLREIVSCFPGEERRKLRQFVNRLKQDGITVISIDNRADFTDPFFDEVILFRHHTIYKKICQSEDTWMIDEILKRGLEAADTTIPEVRDASGKPQRKPVDFSCGRRSGMAAGSRRFRCGQGKSLRHSVPPDRWMVSGRTSFVPMPCSRGLS